MTNICPPLDAGVTRKICWQCGAEFSCGAACGTEKCWCDARSPLEVKHDAADCFCPACLDGEIAMQQARTAKPALVEGHDYYREGAAIVFTAQYHLRRGACCGSGCRHCPYR